MQRVMQTHAFGPHTVAVVEDVEDDGVSYAVLVDGRPVTDPAASPPSFEELVRCYAQSQRTELSAAARHG